MSLLGREASAVNDVLEKAGRGIARTKKMGYVVMVVIVVVVVRRAPSEGCCFFFFFFEQGKARCGVCSELIAFL